MIETELYDWSGIPDPQEFILIPEGKYHVGVVNIERKKSKQGNSVWELKLRILSGEYAGVHIFDNITFTTSSLPRAKWVLEHLGDVDITSFRLTDVHLLGKQAIADVVVDRQPKEAQPGQYWENNKVKFTGYSRPEGFQYLPLDLPPLAQTTTPESSTTAAPEPSTTAALPPRAQTAAPRAQTAAKPLGKMPF